MSEPENPFGNIPFLGDLARMLQGQGSIQWEAARQLAYSNATEGQVEPNVDPAVRFRLAELGRVAELHVQQATGLDTAVGGRAIEIVPVNRTAFTSHTLDAYRPLFETLAGSLGSSPPTITSVDIEPLSSGRHRRRPGPGHARSAARARRPDDAGHGHRVDGRPSGPPFLRPVRPAAAPPAERRDPDPPERPSRPSPRTGASPRTSCCCGSACTRSPPTPRSACPTSGPSWNGSCVTTPAASDPIPAR